MFFKKLNFFLFSRIMRIGSQCKIIWLESSRRNISNKYLLIYFLSFVNFLFKDFLEIQLYFANFETIV